MLRIATWGETCNSLSFNVGNILQRLEDINDSTDYKLNTYLSVVEEQGLDDLLDRGGVFTVFAPTDTAFEQTTV